MEGINKFDSKFIWNNKSINANAFTPLDQNHKKTESEIWIYKQNLHANTKLFNWLLEQNKIRISDLLKNI